MTTIAEMQLLLAKANLENDLLSLNDLAYFDRKIPVCKFGMMADFYFDATDDFSRRDAMLDLATTYYDQARETPNMFVQDESVRRLTQAADIASFLKSGRYKRRYVDPEANISFYIKHVYENEHPYDPSYIKFSALVNGSYRLLGSLDYSGHALQSDADAEAYVRFYCQVCEKLKIYYGCSGFSLLFGGTTRYQLVECYPFFRRFPGLLYADTSAFKIEIEKRDDVVRDANWLTAISDKMLALLGGATQVEAQMSDEITIHRYEGGIVFQAGKLPRIGDVNRGDVPAAYREVSRILRPLRYEGYTRPYYLCVPETVDAQAATQEWITRFD